MDARANSNEWMHASLLWTLLGSVAIGLLGMAFPTNLRAAQRLDSALDNVEWGDSKDEVLEKIKERHLDELRSRPALQNSRVEMQQARTRVLEQIEAIEESYTELEDGEDAYDVSVVADEYTKDNNESLLHVKEDKAQTFYFFIDGSLYKMVVAYKEQYIRGVNFKPFLKQVQRKYGSPEGIERDTIAGQKKLAQASWQDANTRLEVHNKKEVFGTYTMVFSDRERIRKLEESDRKFGGSDKTKEGVSERVKQLSAGSDESQEGVVDGMIGESIEVDLGSDDQDQASDESEQQGDSTSDENEAQASKDQDNTDDTSESDADQATGEAASDSDDDDEDDGVIVY